MTTLEKILAELEDSLKLYDNVSDDRESGIAEGIKYAIRTINEISSEDSQILGSYIPQENIDEFIGMVNAKTPKNFMGEYELGGRSAAFSRTNIVTMINDCTGLDYK